MENLTGEIKGIYPIGVLANGRKEYGVRFEFEDEGGVEVYVMGKEELAQKASMVVDIFGVSYNDIRDYMKAIDLATDEQEVSFANVEDFMKN
jgi:hypothetical protein